MYVLSECLSIGRPQRAKLRRGAWHQASTVEVVSSLMDGSDGLARPTVGSPAPLIELTDNAGETWRLADHLGRTVVLIFHRHIH